MRNTQIMLEKLRLDQLFTIFDVGYGADKVDHKKSVQIFNSGNYDSVFNGLKSKYQQKASTKPAEVNGGQDEDIPF
jgi:hypothetical protein